MRRVFMRSTIDRDPVGRKFVELVDDEDVYSNSGRSMIKLRDSILLPAMILAAAAALPAQTTEQEADEAAAVIAVMEWLAVVDAGDYAGSWDAAAAAFQGAVTREGWVAAVTGARSSFEPFGERVQIASRKMTNPENAPPGEYALMQFRTQVSGERTVIETVVPMKEDGAWKVSGYFVKAE
jgi:hypothetical protein